MVLQFLVIELEFEAEREDIVIEDVYLTNVRFGITDATKSLDDVS